MLGRKRGNVLLFQNTDPYISPLSTDSGCHTVLALLILAKFSEIKLLSYWYELLSDKTS